MSSNPWTRASLFSLLAVIYYMSFASLHAQEDGIVEKKDIEPFQGNWNVTSFHCAEARVQEEVNKQFGSVRVSGREIEIVSKEGKSKRQWLILKLKPNERPREIDLLVYDEGDKRFETVLGIYKFEGNSLVITISFMGGIRPESFEDLVGREVTLKLEKVKDKGF